ncbi:aspartate/glutamate racemase family protein [Priestia sp. AB]|uniref:aspartate/glutamate racemase family protein n=1 Tax=Priestia sp. AB TaxID=3020890 RepID=UPI0023303A49|nr:aspartate/glutamate racemase family protein [Priestia sp. AB]MDC0706258.1 aspartate/glutamate racemase family protein [Priestia sp. AB]MED4207626.1 aspartate/glutamate racemase family protein [Priestia megaterium]
MRTIGLLGGMSWESSSEYYRIINQTVNRKLGGHHSAKSVMYSVDFEEIKKLQHNDRWEEATELMIKGAQYIEKGGADFLIICTNTMHKMASEIQQHISIPILHIADATAMKIKDQGISRIGLLGTKFTMEEDFYKGRLIANYNLEVNIPSDEERQVVHDIIYEELCLGKIEADSKSAYQKIINGLINDGIEGVILGCTEISLLINQNDISIPIFDTTEIHAQAAVEYALGLF